MSYCKSFIANVIGQPLSEISLGHGQWQVPEDADKDLADRKSASQAWSTPRRQGRILSKLTQKYMARVERASLCCGEIIESQTLWPSQVELSTAMMRSSCLGTTKRGGEIIIREFPIQMAGQTTSHICRMQPDPPQRGW